MSVISHGKEARTPLAYRARNDRGSVLIAALMVALIVAALAGHYLRTAFQELRLSHETRMGFQALNLAEGGVEHAVYAFLKDDWTGWQQHSTGNYSRTFQFDEDGDRFVRVITDPSGPPYSVFAEGVVRNGLGTEITRQVLVELRRRGLFANGLTSKREIVFNGNKIVIDSYSSGAGPYDPDYNRLDGGSVATINVDNDAVEVNNADIWGMVATGGGEPRLGPNGTVLGEDSPSGIKVDPDRVSYDFYADFPDAEAPSTWGAWTSYSGNTIGYSGYKTLYRLSDLNVGSGNTVTVYGDATVVVDGNTTVKGELKLGSNSSLHLFILDDMDVGGNGIANPSQKPANLRIFAVGDNVGEIKLHGNGALHGVVYAPNSLVNLKGGGNSGVAFGAIVADIITLNGNYEFHYDEDLADLQQDPGYKVGSWVELYRSDVKMDFAELQASGL